jgi:DNA-binding NarL/FixJ family response regulator
MLGERKGVILVVEDDAFMRRAIQRYCFTYAPAYSVATVKGAIEALDQDLVAAILDVNLPDGSGLTVLEKLRERHPALPVLIHTCDITPDVTLLADRFGAELLCKSDSTERLDDFLRRAVRPRHGSEPRLQTSLDTGDQVPSS